MEKLPNLNKETIKNHRCLARIWDNQRINPNLQCNNIGIYDGLCKMHFKIRPLKFNLITEYPTEELIRIYKIRNKNVEEEIRLLKNENLLDKKKVKDKTIHIIKEEMEKSQSFKYIYNNLEKIIVENNYEIDKDTIMGKLNELCLFKEEQRNSIEKKLSEILEKLGPKKTNLKVSFNNKSKLIVNKKEINKEDIKIKIEELKEEEIEDKVDNVKSQYLSKLIEEYISLIKKLEINIDEINLDTSQLIRIIDLDSLNEENCFEYEIADKIYLINQQYKIIGEKGYWVNEDLPEEYLNNEFQVLHPETCLPIEEYLIYECSKMFHNLTPGTYRQYKWNDFYDELQVTNQIFYIKDY